MAGDSKGKAAVGGPGLIPAPGLYVEGVGFCTRFGQLTKHRVVDLFPPRLAGELEQRISELLVGQSPSVFTSGVPARGRSLDGAAL